MDVKLLSAVLMTLAWSARVHGMFDVCLCHYRWLYDPCSLGDSCIFGDDSSMACGKSVFYERTSHWSIRSASIILLNCKFV